MLPDADRLLSERGVRGRCEFLGGSFFNPIATKGKVWTICQVLHDWPDAECRAILQRIRAAMRETDRLLVIEMLTVPCQPNPGIAMLDMMMLLYFGEARQRTVEEYEELFRATGLAQEWTISQVAIGAGTAGPDVNALWVHEAPTVVKQTIADFTMLRTSTDECLKALNGSVSKRRSPRSPPGAILLSPSEWQSPSFSAMSACPSFSTG